VEARNAPQHFGNMKKRMTIKIRILKIKVFKIFLYTRTSSKSILKWFKPKLVGIFSDPPTLFMKIMATPMDTKKQESRQNNKITCFIKFKVLLNCSVLYSLNTREI
jgi:hypothetical protein